MVSTAVALVLLVLLLVLLLLLLLALLPPPFAFALLATLCGALFSKNDAKSENKSKHSLPDLRILTKTTSKQTRNVAILCAFILNMRMRQRCQTKTIPNNNNTSEIKSQ